MLIFGAVMVIMMIYRPQGLVTDEKRAYRVSGLDDSDGPKGAPRAEGGAA